MRGASLGAMTPSSRKRSKPSSALLTAKQRLSANRNTSALPNRKLRDAKPDIPARFVKDNFTRISLVPLNPYKLHLVQTDLIPDCNVPVEKIDEKIRITDDTPALAAKN